MFRKFLQVSLASGAALNRKALVSQVPISHSAQLFSPFPVTQSRMGHFLHQTRELHHSCSHRRRYQLTLVRHRSVRSSGQRYPVLLSDHLPDEQYRFNRLRSPDSRQLFVCSFLPPNEIFLTMLIRKRSFLVNTFSNPSGVLVIDRGEHD